MDMGIEGFSDTTDVVRLRARPTTESVSCSVIVLFGGSDAPAPAPASAAMRLTEAPLQVHASATCGPTS